MAMTTEPTPSNTEAPTERLIPSDQTTEDLNQTSAETLTEAILPPHLAVRYNWRSEATRRLTAAGWQGHMRSMFYPIVGVQLFFCFLAAHFAFVAFSAVNIHDLNLTGPSQLFYGIAAVYFSYASCKGITHSLLSRKKVRKRMEEKGAGVDFFHNFLVWVSLLLIASFAAILMGTLGIGQPNALLRIQDSILAATLAMVPLEILLNGGGLVHGFISRKRNFSNTVARMLMLNAMSFVAIAPHQLVPIHDSLELHILGGAFSAVCTLFAVVLVYQGPRDYSELLDRIPFVSNLRQ